MKIVSVVGARPQFVKMAAVARALEAAATGQGSAEIRNVIVHTGQHYDTSLSQVFFDELAIPAPHVNLAVGSASHGAQTGRMTEKIEAILMRERPDAVLVFGDTNSTLAGALAAAKLGIPVAHVEAGLRSYDKSMPEEINRVLTDHASTLLFCPTEAAVDNLAREGFEAPFAEGSLSDEPMIAEMDASRFTPDSPLVINTGDVMFDHLGHVMASPDRGIDILARCRVEQRGYCLATIHRAANTDDPTRLRGIVDAFNRIAESSCPIVFPMHPRTAAAVARLGNVDWHPRVSVVEPVTYREMLALETHARAILTDSGGVQKEAYMLGVPCVTVRRHTEWIETLIDGWNRLVEPDPNQLVEAVRQALAERPSTQPRPVYGRGDAGRLVVAVLGRWIGARR